MGWCVPANGLRRYRRAKLACFVADTGADELIVASNVYDPDKRIRSIEILARRGAALISPITA